MGQNIRNLLITGLALSLGVAINKVIQKTQHRKLIKQLRKLTESFKKRNETTNSPVATPLPTPLLILDDNSSPPSPIPTSRFNRLASNNF